MYTAVTIPTVTYVPTVCSFLTLQSVCVLKGYYIIDFTSFNSSSQATSDVVPVGM